MLFLVSHVFAKLLQCTKLASKLLPFVRYKYIYTQRTKIGEMNASPMKINGNNDKSNSYSETTEKPKGFKFFFYYIHRYLLPIFFRQQ